MRIVLRIGDKEKFYGYVLVIFKYNKWWEGYKGGYLIKFRRSKFLNYFKF